MAETETAVDRLLADALEDAASPDQTREIETLIVDLDAEGMLRLNGAFTPAQMAQMLADGARAVNQGLPPIPSEELAGRYRAMCQGLLYGMAEQPVAAARPTSRHAG